MNNTFILFEDRKAEIEFYYSIMMDIENNTGKIQTIDNSKFFRILKSNFLLMLYNLVEACVVSGMLEIYESLKQSQSGYNELIEEIQSLWSKYKIGEIYKSSGTRSSYEKGVREIIAQVITDEPVFLNRAALEISGNLDARRIKNLCDIPGVLEAFYERQFRQAEEAAARYRVAELLKKSDAQGRQNALCAPFREEASPRPDQGIEAGCEPFSADFCGTKEKAG